MKFVKDIDLNNTKNYYPLDDKSMFYKHFVYIDAGDNHVGDNILRRNGVRVKFVHDLMNKALGINIVHCKVWKGDVDKFLKSMKDLENAHIILKTPYYMDIRYELRGKVDNVKYDDMVI